MEYDYDVAIVGGGPAGLSVGAELAKLGNRILLMEKGKIGDTDRAWIVPGSILATADASVQSFAYNGVRRFLEYTPTLSIQWEAVAPWDSDERWKCYPYIRQTELLNHWADVIRQSKSTVIENTAYLDHIVEENAVRVRAQGGQEYRTRMLLDASGYHSSLAQKQRISREGYFWWSVYGYELEFENTAQLSHPGTLGAMQVGDYMLWQSFKSSPLDARATLSQLKPIMEYEVLDEKKVFVFILFFTTDTVEKSFIKNHLDDLLQRDPDLAAFRTGRVACERFGWYPSGGLSQQCATDRIAFIGDAGCWTIPAGWGMSFILQNYRTYAAGLHQLLQDDALDQINLNRAAVFNERQKYEICMDKVVLHFLAYAESELIDRFTKRMLDTFGGGMLETMFCLQLDERQSIDALKAVVREFSITELAGLLSREREPELLLTVLAEFAESALIDGIRRLLGKEREAAGFSFTPLR
ncbi:FAD-dependent oxidoreductase [Azotosporobacter soli]|uniref:FAD-dependent oxidoreductase n=1 Tax=Azotosporobacter soli TaxID=3055040 RepID=UPI0031FF0FB4